MADGGTSNTKGVTFWPGNTLGWEGIVAVDGIAYERLGTSSQDLPTMDNLNSVTPLAVSYDSQYSNFTFATGHVQLTANFLSPVLPKALCRTNIALSYLTVSARSTDNGTHDVQLYNDINAAWIAYEQNVTVEWAMYEGSSTVNGTQGSGNNSLHTAGYTLCKIRTYSARKVISRNEAIHLQRCQWEAQNMTFSSGYYVNVQYRYINSLTLQNNVDGDFRGYGGREPVLAFAHSLGSVPGLRPAVIFKT
jgi:hypothetical protein